MSNVDIQNDIGDTDIIFKTLYVTGFEKEEN